MHNYKFKPNTNLTLPPSPAEPPRLHHMADLATAQPDSARAGSTSTTVASATATAATLWRSTCGSASISLSWVTSATNTYCGTTVTSAAASARTAHH
jgi:hypothetical protein